MAIEHRMHGGQCCGLRHVYNFEYGYSEADRQRTERYIANQLERGKLVEIVLTDQQLDPSDDEWMPDNKRVRATLRKLGFKKVTRFRNGRGNYCNIFHAHQKRESLVRGR